MAAGNILAAGVDARELRLEVRFLQRAPDLVQEAASARELLDALVGHSVSLVVIGPKLPDAALDDAIRRVRESAAGRRVSILAMIPAAEPEGAEGAALAAGANAALRRPLDRFVLESWVSKLLDVPSRVRARIPVHVQVVGSRRGESEHFYGLSRNLSVHGMLLASPVRIDAEDLDLEIDLPESEGRVRVLGRIAREAPEVGWPYVGYGIEFLFLPETAQRVIDRLVRREAPHDPPRSLWAPGAIHSTLRKDEWIYELSDPARTEIGFLVEIRRASREGWRAGRASPFYVVEEPTPEGALAAARAFVQRHG
jgi:CheY-like chemotaxis protein